MRAVLCGCRRAPGSLPGCQGEDAGHLCVPGPVLFWVILILVVVVSFSSFVLCHRRACRKWIGQSKCMYLGAMGGQGALC